MERIKLADRHFELSIPFDAIDKAIGVVASEINRDLKDKDPLFICILNGSFMFAADLLKKITINCQVSFVKMSSYNDTTSTGNVISLIGLTADLAGRNVVILEDIIDTGLTIELVLNQINTLQPNSVKVATLFYKPDVCKINIPIDYIGMPLPNKFVVGYGLDYNEYGRNLKDLYTVIDQA